MRMGGVMVFYGAVAQLGERCVRNAEVEGSIPFRSTISAGYRCGPVFVFLKTAACLSAMHRVCAPYGT